MYGDIMNKSFKEYFIEKYPYIFEADVNNHSEDAKEIMRTVTDLIFTMIEEYDSTINGELFDKDLDEVGWEPEVQDDSSSEAEERFGYK